MCVCQTGELHSECHTCTYQVTQILWLTGDEHIFVPSFRYFPTWAAMQQSSACRMGLWLKAMWRSCLNQVLWVFAFIPSFFFKFHVSRQAGGRPLIHLHNFISHFRVCQKDTKMFPSTSGSTPPSLRITSTFFFLSTQKVSCSALTLSDLWPLNSLQAVST